MTVRDNKPTRGKGIFEPILARWRSGKANRLIPSALRSGRVLDIGCGTYPYFLAHTSFQQKFAVDQLPLNPESARQHEIQSFTIDLNKTPKLPFDNDFFSAITLLAVVEHLDPASMAKLFREAHRALQPGGMIILTTPAVWSDGLLKVMAGLGMVSADEIREHTYVYTLPLLGWYFGQAGFEMSKIRFGYFEFALNMWATATK